MDLQAGLIGRATAPERAWLLCLASAGWAGYVWATRITNVWSDDATSLITRLLTTALSASFLVAALLGLAMAWRLRTTGPQVWMQTVLVAWTAWTLAVWVVRGVGIATGGNSLGFVLVHVALGVISLLTVAGALWSVRTWLATVHASPGDAGPSTGAG